MRAPGWDDVEFGKTAFLAVGADETFPLLGVWDGCGCAETGTGIEAWVC